MEALITETKYADVHTQKMNSVFAGLIITIFSYSRKMQQTLTEFIHI